MVEVVFVGGVYDRVVVVFDDFVDVYCDVVVDDFFFDEVLDCVVVVELVVGVVDVRVFGERCDDRV